MIIDFFIVYWRIVVIAALLVANLIVSIFKRPKVLNTIVEVANSFVPTAVNEAEGLYGKGNGDKKLNYATKLVLDYICYRFNISQKVANKYVFAIQTEIEKVLSTPQKKGD